MNALHHAVKGLLMPVCLAATAKSRETINKQVYPPEFTKAILELRGLDSRWGVVIARAIAGAMGLPTDRIEQPNSNTELFCVVVPIRDSVSHYYKLKTPAIMVHPGDMRLLTDKGARGETKMVLNDFRVSTDEEVEECIDDLNERQIKGILTLDIFAPIIAPLFAEPEELVAAP